MSGNRSPLNYELAGKVFRLILDDGRDINLSFSSGDHLIWAEKGKTPQGEYYEAAKIDEITYFVNFEFTNIKPRTNLTVILDLEQSLTTVVTTITRYDPKCPNLCDTRFHFGYISIPGIAAPKKRHEYTRDLLGKRICWNYSPFMQIVHVYYSTDYVRITVPNDPPTPMGQAILDELERAPYDEKAYFVKIKENVYLVSALEQVISRRGGGGNSLVFLIDTERVHDVGRSFGVTGQSPDFPAENYIFGAYGDFVYSDGRLESKPRTNPDYVPWDGWDSLEYK
jgi:hypothetical protein